MDVKNNNENRTLAIFVAMATVIVAVGMIYRNSKNKNVVTKSNVNTDSDHSSFSTNETVTLKRLFPNVYLVYSSSKEALNKIFVRFQGCVDSAEFKNQIFSAKEYADWFSKDGKSDVYNAFKGFNIPDYVIEAFIDGDFSNISTDEQWLLDRIGNTAEKPYYVIGYIKGDENTTLRHELAHALYYLNPQYKKQVNLILIDFLKSVEPNELQKVHDFFSQLKYHDDIFLDELHAYLIADKNTLTKLKFWDANIEYYSYQLNDLFKKEYLKFFGQPIEETINKQK